jgi:hypothetical protein
MIEHIFMAASQSHDVAGSVGGIIGSLLVPGVGLLLLIEGFRRRKRASGGTALIVVGSLVLVLGVVGVAGTSLLKAGNSGTGTDALRVGDCVTDKDYVARRVDAEAVDCTRDDAIYELAAKGDGAAKCPDGKREDSSYSLLVNSGHTYCFTFNVREGSCYHVDADKNDLTAVPCTSSEATVKVDRRIDGTTDVAECPEGTKGQALPDPPRLICLTRP